MEFTNNSVSTQIYSRENRYIISHLEYNSIRFLNFNDHRQGEDEYAAYISTHPLRSIEPRIDIG